MKLEATLPLDALRKLIEQLLPLQIQLGEDNGAHLEFKDPESVALVAGKGLRVVCSAKLSWPVLGIPVPVVLHSISMLLLPSVTRRADGLVLLFEVEIERMDLAMLPALVDMHVTDRLNAELEQRDVELVWDFTNTLSHAFPLPPMLTSVDMFALQVVDGEVDVDEQNLHLVVRFRADVTRKPAAPVPA